MYLNVYSGAISVPFKKRWVSRIFVPGDSKEKKQLIHRTAGFLKEY